MKQYVEVYWTHWSNRRNKESELLTLAESVIVQQPKPILSEIAKERIGVPRYMHCPAFVASCHNSFLIRSPFDITITISDDDEVITDRYGQEFFDLHIGNRSNQTAKGNPFLMHIFPTLLFFAKEPVEIELLDPILLHSDASRNIRVVPGRFDIQKWVRPVECSLEVVNRNIPLQIKIDDPLFMVRFSTKNNIPVKLVRVPYTDELKKFSMSFVIVKQLMPRLSLAKMYELAKDHVNLWWSKK